MRRLQGETPVFADIDPGTLLVDPADVEAKITSRMRVIIAVDYAEAALRLRHPSMAYKALRACSGRRGRAVGALADLSVFSLYPVKAMTNGEGGVITTERFEASTTGVRIDERKFVSIAAPTKAPFRKAAA